MSPNFVYEKDNSLLIFNYRKYFITSKIIYEVVFIINSKSLDKFRCIFLTKNPHNKIVLFQEDKMPSHQLLWNQSGKTFSVFILLYIFGKKLC